jgi:hypothetical protein
MRINTATFSFTSSASNKHLRFTARLSRLGISAYFTRSFHRKRTVSAVSQMFKLLQTALGVWFNSDKGSSTISSYVNLPTVYTHPAKLCVRASSSNGIEVRVGRLPHACSVHIPRSALKACPVLRARLVQGYKVMNADPVVFEIILDYLDCSSLLGLLRPSARSPLTQLTGSSGKMLKLAKAWHLADMLDDMQLQNKLVDTYRVLYLELLNAREKIPLEHEPFVYLQDSIGTHTKIEKFIIDFFAGLTRYTCDFSAEELLPFRHDIAQSLKLRRAQLVVQKRSGDMIASGSTCFHVSKLDKTRHATLHVIIPTRVPSGTDLNSLSSQRGCSASTLSSSVYPPGMPRAPISATSLICGRGHRVRLSLPGITSITGQPEVLVSRTMMHALQSTFGTAIRPSHTRPVSLMTSRPGRAPFMDYKPMTRRQRTDVASDDDSSDEDTGYRLFPPPLPPLRYDSGEIFGSSVTRDR